MSDQKLLSDSRLADLMMKRQFLCAKVSEIPGASIDSDNVKLDLSKFGSDAHVFRAEFGSEVASLSEASGFATLDFTSAVSASDEIKIFVDLDL